MTRIDIDWILIGSEDLPRWKRLVGVAHDGRPFLPVAIYMKELNAARQAQQQGIPMILKEDHLYLPVDFLMSIVPVLKGARKGIIDEIKKELEKAKKRESKHDDLRLRDHKGDTKH